MTMQNRADACVGAQLNQLSAIGLVQAQKMIVSFRNKLRYHNRMVV